MANPLRFAAANVRSLRWPNGSNLTGLMNRLGADVLALSETHLQHERDAQLIRQLNVNTHSIYNLGRTMSCGTAIAVRSSAVTTVVELPLMPLLNDNEPSLLQGRACAAHITLEDDKFNVIAVYAPKMKKERSTFLRQLADATCDLSEPTIFPGDWNCALKSWICFQDFL